MPRSRANNNHAISAPLTHYALDDARWLDAAAILELVWLTPVSIPRTVDR